MRLIIQTNLSDKFKVPLLKEMAKEPLIVDNVVSFKVVTDEELLKKQDRKEHYRLTNQQKREAQRNRKIYYHICPNSANGCKILLNDDFTCKRCNVLVPESERIDVDTLDKEYKERRKNNRLEKKVQKFQKFKKEIEQNLLNAKSISNELINLEQVDNRVKCYSTNGRMKCCHNIDDVCSCKCHLDYQMENP